VARAGSFGRLPRQAPDLSGAIAALQREAQNRFDQNMVDAWQNGGKVGGKAVTDSRLLAHFKKRRNDLSKTDPLYTMWDNRITQYEFSIAESKLMVKWDNEQVSEKEVSQFYKDWMAKTPKNTEFYRTLSKNAGKWGAAARGRAGGRNANAAAAAHQNWVDNYYEKHVKNGDIAKQALLVAAKAFGAADPGAKDLSEIYTNGVGYQRFLDLMEGNIPEDDALVRTIMNDALKEIQKGDPNFTWSQHNITEILGESRRGLAVLIKNSTTQGEKTQWTDRQTATRWAGSHVSQADEIDIAFDASEDFHVQMSACHGEYACENKAMRDFRDVLNKVENTVGGGGLNGYSNPFVSGPLSETARQLDAMIAGKEYKSAGAPNIFDLQGPDSPWGSGPLVGLSKENADKKMNLQKPGSWISYENDPVLKNPDGSPALTIVVHGPDDPKPAEAVASPGSGSAVTVDVPRPDGKGHTKETIRPPAYIVPKPVMGVAVDTLGNPVDGTGKRLFDELTVLGEDGVVHTTYRIGSGTEGDEYIFSAHPPTFDNGEKKTVPMGEGRGSAYAFPEVKDPTGGPSTFIATKSGTDNMHQRIRPGDPTSPYVIGTYGTQTGAEMGSLIEGTYAKHKDPREANQIVNGAIGRQRVEATRLLGSTSLADQKLGTALLSDLKAAEQVNTLTKLGFVGKALDDQFRAINDFKPEDDKYLNQLKQRGFRIGIDTIDDLHARVNALKTLDEWEQKNPIHSGSVIVGGTGRVERSPEDAAALTAARGAASRSQILNPTIAFNRLNVPGLPNGFQPEGAPSPDQFSRWAQGLDADNKFGAGPAGSTYVPPSNVSPTSTTTPPPNTYTPPPNTTIPGSTTKPDPIPDNLKETQKTVIPGTEYQTRKDAKISSRRATTTYRAPS